MKNKKSPFTLPCILLVLLISCSDIEEVKGQILGTIDLGEKSAGQTHTLTFTIPSSHPEAKITSLNSVHCENDTSKFNTDIVFTDYISNSAQSDFFVRLHLIIKDSVDTGKSSFNIIIDYEVTKNNVTKEISDTLIVEFTIVELLENIPTSNNLQNDHLPNINVGVPFREVGDQKSLHLQPKGCSIGFSEYKSQLIFDNALSLNAFLSNYDKSILAVKQKKILKTILISCLLFATLQE